MVEHINKYRQREVEGVATMVCVLLLSPAYDHWLRCGGHQKAAAKMSQMIKAMPTRNEDRHWYDGAQGSAKNHTKVIAKRRMSGPRATQSRIT